MKVELSPLARAGIRRACSEEHWVAFESSLRLKLRFQPFDGALRAEAGPARSIWVSKLWVVRYVFEQKADELYVWTANSMNDQ